MAEIRTIGLKDRLWHELRADLAKVAPNLASDDHLICCCCGRLLPFEAFSLEHIIPQQALADDPPTTKQIPLLRRSGYTLLCNSPLQLHGKRFSKHGCNSWKGKHYDKGLRSVFNKTALTSPVSSNHLIISTITAAYLAMFTAFGYQIALSGAGALLRRQFFNPRGFLPAMPALCQLVMMGDTPAADEETLDYWNSPFSFDFDEFNNCCTVVIRNYVVNLPISRDPRLPVSSVLAFTPSKYKLRPDFRAFFS